MGLSSLTANHTFYCAFYLFDVGFFVLVVGFSMYSDGRDKPDTMKTERFIYWVHVTFALVLLLLLLKFVIWICKDSKFFTFSEKENKKQTKITRYDKYNLVFGYIGISIISIITQGIILWTGHDFEVIQKL